ncbi:hypothetical protein BBI11_02435 [Planococcus maritimus]|uniref:saccharopine dehydrogenase family protein n=1 Tax=Planococcus maritimus TaxID=192421 RepID=UPI00080EE8E8|nr:saccharopine dehydrogenase NADP-binding domain-containing protein [Planococcus maritimus]ANU15991.1 hypothetical protein BBI11_02435 [Planococcus maritimus]
MTTWLLYGATGYTGKLIAQEAVERGMRPVLAGRSKEKVQPLAEELDLEFQIFELNDQTAEQLAGIDLVLHCAGPFEKTSKPMIHACLKAGAHYLDITGEISVFEHTHSLHEEALQKNIILCSGVGFDVIPTDCTALKLKQALPDAIELALGFDSDSGISPGTMKTMVEGLGGGNTVRKEGQLTDTAIGKQQRLIDFGRGKKSAMAIPWGDVATAYYTTAIPNISAWIPTPKAAIYAARLMNVASPLLSSEKVKQPLLRWVEQGVEGPNQEERAGSAAYIWGQAKNADGVVKTCRIRTANVYDLTVYGALEVTQRLLSGDYASGSWTPAALFGPDLLESLPGSGRFEIDSFYPGNAN